MKNALGKDPSFVVVFGCGRRPLAWVGVALGLWREMVLRCHVSWVGVAVGLWGGLGPLRFVARVGVEVGAFSCGGVSLLWKRIWIVVSLSSLRRWVMSWSLLSMVMSWLMYLSPCMVDLTCLLPKRWVSAP